MPADFFGVNQPTLSPGRKGGVPIQQDEGGFFNNLFGFVDGLTDIIASSAQDAARTAQAIANWDNPYVYDSESGNRYELLPHERHNIGRHPQPYGALNSTDIIEGVPNIVVGVAAAVAIALVVSK